MKKIFIYASMAIAAVTLQIVSSAHARDYVHAVGSSTVFPFVTVVAEAIAKQKNITSPVIESTGTGGGFKLFCGGSGPDYPDISMASRAIKNSEKAICESNNAEWVEFIIGIDGIVLANSKKADSVSISLEDIFKGLAAKVPNDNGNPVENTYNSWNDIDSALPNNNIRVYGPPPSSGTRDAFLSLAMKSGGKKAFPDIAKNDSKAFKKLYKIIREDGAFIEAGENDTLIVNKLSADPESFGIFGFSFLDLNRHAVQAATIDGVEATYETIQDGSYPLSRGLYVYVKKDNFASTPNLKAFIEEVLSEKASGDDGYLVDKALIPSTNEVRNTMRMRLKNVTQ